MVEKNNWRLAAIIAVGIILGVFLVDHFINSAAHASAYYVNSLDTGASCQNDLKDLKSAYNACLDVGYSDLKDQQAATDFLVKNHEVLEFPSCFRDLNYMTTGLEDALYVGDGNYMRWTPENLTLYCWNNDTAFFDCEDLCSYQ